MTLAGRQGGDVRASVSPLCQREKDNNDKADGDVIVRFEDENGSGSEKEADQVSEERGRVEGC